MKKELPKQYNPADYEDEIYAEWEKSGFFNPDRLKGEPYAIMMPPPNVTGVLHLGHALENFLMDIMARYQRMNGKKVLLLPGTDHAAVATQAKVEKVLIGQGIRNPRQELGREKLLEKIREYADNSKATILKQIKKMGTSCDWSRLAYTFDEVRNRAVNEVFIKMYNDGLIYRGKRIINWDAKLQTTISDDEIVWQEEKAPYYYLKYGPFIISTARPETKFGDKYVVMHPDDKRYKKYKHGDKFDCEWINGKVTATVIKDEVIDMKFGTGVMTITPWHDLVDFEIAERHKLAGEQIIDFNGKLMPIAGEFVGLSILEARPKIVEKLKHKGLVAKVEENYLHRVAKGDRSQAAVEPQIKEQWFVDVNKKIPGKKKSLKDLMREAVTIGHNGDAEQKVKITPERFQKIYLHWIDNLRDWCISRQIWWGHRIPVWYCGGRDKGKCLPQCHQPIVSVETPKTCPVCGSKDLIQDEDTLDTWFSSGLWTFSTLGWPWQKTWDLKIYDGAKIFEVLKSGEKRFETRAGKPKGADKDWREFKVGDIINFSLVEEGSEKVLSKEIVTKQIVSIRHFNSLDALLKKIEAREVHPYKPEQYRSWWETRPYFKDRIEKYGIWAFELKESDLSQFHPTAWMQMGYEILFFWLARMILMSTYVLDQIPFKNVYIHGMLRSETGKKFSKSSGNNIDPLEVIAKYGADALRLSVIAGIAPGNDSKFYEEKVEGARNLVNKLWNISRYIITNCHFGGSEERATDRISSGVYRSAGASLQNDSLTAADNWILGRLHTLIAEVSDDFDNFRFSEAAERLRVFTWNDLADWYLEVCKFEKNFSKNQILLVILNDLLKLWQPFIPFVTEEIWQEMGKKELLLVEKWPNSDAIASLQHDKEEFEAMKEIIIAIRNARAENKVEPARKVKAVIYAGEKKDLLVGQAELIKSLRTSIGDLEVKTSGEKIAGAIYAAVGEIEIYLLGAVDSEKEKIRLKKEIANLEKAIKANEGKLKNKEFVNKAPEAVVKKERQKLKDWQAELKKFREQGKNLK